MIGVERIYDAVYLDPIGYTAATTLMTTLTAPGSANTKGDYLQLTPGLSGPIDGFDLCVHTSGAAATRSYLMDLAIGLGTVAQEVVISNVYASIGGSGIQRTFRFPIPLLGPLNFFARYQTDVEASANLQIQIMPFRYGILDTQEFSRVATIGANTAASRGTSMTALESPDWGAYVNLSPVLPFNTRAIIIAAGNAGDYGKNDTNYSLEVSIGSGATKYVKIPALRILQNAIWDSVTDSAFGPFPVDIPIGSTISTRIQASSSGLDPLDIVVYALG